MSLERAISKAGAASRVEARAWVAAGRVKVGGRIVRDPRRRVDPARDRILLDGRPLPARRPIYLALHKPKGTVTTRRDERGRRTVYDLLPAGTPHVVPIGRLDLDTSGLLLLTNDTAFAHELASPDYHVPKTYQVKASSRLAEEALDRLRAGPALRDGPTRPAAVERLRDPGGRTVFTITITEGRNRQVRRMVEAVGAKVRTLARIAIGPLSLGALPAGASRPLTASELAALRRTIAAGPRRRPRGAAQSRSRSRRPARSYCCGMRSSGRWKA
ncbi:MAG: pseudouridine synthase [Planctomycetota bacterium]